MSSYQIFIRLIAQLSQKDFADIDVGDKQIKIYKTNNKYILSTAIRQDRDDLPKVFRWQERGPFLQIDPSSNTLHLIQEMEGFPQFISFKHTFSHFMQIAQDWEELLA